MTSGVKKGGRGGGGNVSARGNRSQYVLAECDGELCVAMQIYCPVCLAMLAAEDKNTRHRRGINRWRERERERQRQNGNETQKENERAEQREGGKEIKEER